MLQGALRFRLAVLFEARRRPLGSALVSPPSVAWQCSGKPAVSRLAVLW